MSNPNIQTAEKPQAGVVQQQRFSVAINSDIYQKMIKDTLREPGRINRFIASITSAVAVNPELQKCTPSSITGGALLGESLNLSPSPQLGQYYLVPFKSKEKRDKITGEIIERECVKAQFVLGYKGFIQLAIRSGQYKKLTVLEIKEGELLHFDPLNEEIECKIIDDYEEREATPTAGYYAMFEYCNGFRKAMYWSLGKMMAHADKYSPAFSALKYRQLLAGEIPQNEMWRYSSFWYKNFDDMAKKTMLRQLISKWGIMSTELQQAFVQDAGAVDMSTGELLTTPEEQLDIVSDVEPSAVEPESAADEVQKIDMDAL